MQQDVESKVLRATSDVLGIPVADIKLTDRFVDDLGADSIDQVELVMAFEDRLAVELSDDEAARLATGHDVVALISRKLSLPVAARPVPSYVRSGYGYTMSLFLGTEKYDALEITCEKSGKTDRYDWLPICSPTTPQEIDAFQTAAVQGLQSCGGYASRVCSAGEDALKAFRLKNWTSKPTHCPYCQSRGVREIGPWPAHSGEDPDNTATLTEYQCHSPICNGRSFWV